MNPMLDSPASFVWGIALWFNANPWIDVSILLFIISLMWAHMSGIAQYERDKHDPSVLVLHHRSSPASIVGSIGIACIVGYIMVIHVLGLFM